MRMLATTCRAIGTLFRGIVVALGAITVAGGIIAYADYSATTGGSTSFASKVISSVHYAAFLVCDAVAGETNCAAVKAGNTAGITDQAVVVADPNVLAAVNAGVATTGSAVPAQAIYWGVNVGGNLTGFAPGTAGTAGSQVVSVQGIASMTPLLANPGTPANWGVVATGAAPPANAIYLGANAGGATGGHVAGLIQCDSHIFKHITSATDTLAVQGVASQSIYVCGALGQAAGTATFFLENTASANANCASTLTQIAGVATMVANGAAGFYNPIWGGLKNTSGNGLCINSTGTGGVDVDIWYTQF